MGLLHDPVAGVDDAADEIVVEQQRGKRRVRPTNRHDTARKTFQEGQHRAPEYVGLLYCDRLEPDLCTDAQPSKRGLRHSQERPLSLTE